MIEEIAIFKDKLSENDLILYENILKFLENIDYTDHYDEFEYLVSIVDSVESPRDTLKNLLELHLNKLSSMLGLDFTYMALLSQKLELLKVISNIENIDKNYLIDVRDNFNMLENSFDKLQLLYDSLSDMNVRLDTYEILNVITEDLISYLTNILTFKEEKSFDEILEEVKFNKRISYLKKLNINKDNVILEYYKNNIDHNDLDTVIILFKDYLETQTYDKVSSILTILVLSEGDVLENYKIIESKINVDLDRTLIEKLKVHLG